MVNVVCHLCEVKYVNTLIFMTKPDFRDMEPFFVHNLQLLKSVTKTNKFHKLCSRMAASKFLDRMKTIPIITPRKNSGNIRCDCPCTRAKVSAETPTEPHGGIYLVKEGNKNPRNRYSSHTGAKTDTTIAYKIMATGSLAPRDFSNMVGNTGPGISRTFNSDKKTTTGKLAHAKMASPYPGPFQDKGNQCLGSGW